MHRPHRDKLAIIGLLLASAVLPLLCVPTTPPAIIHRLSGDYRNASKERYFQILNYSTSDSVIIRAPPQVDNDSRFGESFDAFRHVNQTFVLIGAPHQDEKNGSVYLCAYEKFTFHCKSEELIFKTPDSDKGGRRGMLLGSSVSSVTVDDKGYGLYCGHLFHKSHKHSSKFIGACNMYSHDDGSVSSVVPCYTKNCLFGFSSRMLPHEERADELAIAVSAPGVHVGSGKLYYSELPTKDFGAKLGTLAFSNTERNRKDNLYYGYDTDITFLKGAKKENGTYHIIVPALRKLEDKDTSGVADVYQVNSKDSKKAEDVKIEYGLTEGKLIASVKSPFSQGYGISVAVGIFNEIQFAVDFIVGEPFYNEYENNRYDTGRVHVYCKDESKDVKIHSIIVGPEARGRFGTSVSRVPDINYDKVDEFLVGCPYCDDGNGVVFFFLGRKDCNYTAADQIIRIRDIKNHYDDIPQSIFGFGWSLSTKLDIDDNGVNDLLMGAPKSNVVVLARGRDSIVAVVWLDANWNVNAFYQGPGGNKFIVNYYLKIPPKFSRSSLKLRIRVRFSFDDEMKEKDYKRLVYGEAKKKTSEYSEDIDVTIKAKRTVSENRKIELKNGKLKLVLAHWKRETGIPLIVRYSFELLSYTASNIESKDYPFPRFVEEGTLFYKLKLVGCDKKKEEQRCDHDFSLNITRVNERKNMNNTVEYGSSNVTFIIRITNHGPLMDLINCKMRLQSRGGLSVSAIYFKHIVETSWEKLTCVNDDADDDICDVSSLLTEDIQDMKVILNPTDLTHKSKWPSIQKSGDPQFIAIAESTNDPNLNNNKATYSMNLRFDPKVTMTASRDSQQTVIDYRNSTQRIRRRERIHATRIGPRMSQLYQLVNTDLADVYDIKLNITIPVASEFGDRLFYFANEVRAGGKMVSAGPRVVSRGGKSLGRCTLPEDQINPLNLKIITNAGAARRMKRSAQAENVIADEKAQSSKGKDRIVCGERSKNFGIPKCVEIHCTVDRLVKNEITNVVVDGWLWAETTLKEHLKDIELVTNAHGQITGIPPSANVPNATRLIIPSVTQSTHFYFENVSAPILYQFPIWIIILSVIIGILLLSLIVLCLKKVGFFKRRRRPYATHNLRFMRYGESVSEIHDGGPCDDFVSENGSDMDKLPLDGGSSSRLLPDRTADVVLFDEHMAVGPSSVDTGISDEVQSSSSSPKQALEPRDKNYESASLGMSEDNSI